MTTFLGTPCYVAPEIIKQEPYDCSVDCWSIGVIIYLLLSGYPPFMNDDTKELFELIKKADYTFPDEDFSNVSSEAKDLIKNLLLLDVHKRLTAEEI